MARNARDEVMAELCAFISEARRHGRNGVHDAQAAFQGTPLIVLYEAETMVEMEETEAWWQSVERTIDGEIIRAAIADTSEKKSA